MIKILIVDDQLVVREKLEAVLGKQRDLMVVGAATDNDKLLAKYSYCNQILSYFM